MFGDQGFFERGETSIKFHCLKQLLFQTGHNVSFSRSREENLVERLDGLVSIPQEWHKKRVRTLKL